MAKDLLLEIGTEEIPARFIPPSLAQIRDIAGQGLQKRRLDHLGIETFGTPRRLALIVRDLADYQRDLTDEIKGPPARAAFDSEGRPTKAAEGFARGQKVTVEELVVKDTPAGSYVFALRRETGSPVKDVVAGLLEEVVASLDFPKPMRWGYGEMRFARPIRWLVAILGEEVIDMETAGLKSGCTSRGHRFLGSREVELDCPGEYMNLLEANYVIADQDRRRDMIWRQIRDLATTEGGWVDEDEDLLEEVTFLLEYPTALCGGFSPAFLELPREVLITLMREHQRYFPVQGPDGNLLPKFITVRNGTSSHLDVVRKGNEKVLRARLADAAFFYQEDLKLPLPQKVDRLKNIVFQEGLGTLFQKAERLQGLAVYLAGVMGLPEEVTKEAARCAYLAKADLVSNMVYEFPELQGIMGSYYGAEAGEAATVSQGIREHYLPRSAGDQLPETDVGAVVAIVDKIDNIVGCFATGIQPTGSQDPYALRRQALGIFHILLAHGYHVSVQSLAAQSYRAYLPEVRFKTKWEAVLAEISPFLRQRLESILEEKGFKYDVVNAVLAAGWDNPVDAYLRAKALAAFRGEPEFGSLLEAFVRATNLAQKAGAGLVSPPGFIDPAEHHLFEELQRVQQQAGPLIARKKYLDAFKTIAMLQKPINEFFNGVMVMVDDQRVRENRLGLLKSVSEYIIGIADLSKIT